MARIAGADRSQERIDGGGRLNLFLQDGLKQAHHTDHGTKCLESPFDGFTFNPMKKVFPLTMPGKADARVLESIKHEARKYVKRERRKPVPPDFEQWDFACKVGAAQAAAESKHLRDLGTAIDAVAATGAESVYLEITAIPARRMPPPRPPVVPSLENSEPAATANNVG